MVAGPIVAWLGPRGTYVFGGAISLLAVFAAIPALEARKEPDQGEERGAHTGDAASLVLGDTSAAGYPAESLGAGAAGPAGGVGTETETTVSTR